MPRPIILGVVGDSAAGKTTITRGLVRLLGEEHVTHIAADDYHRYDRRQRAERNDHAAAPRLQLPRHHGAAPRARARRASRSSSRSTGTRTARSGPPCTSSRASSRSSRGCSATTRETLRDSFDVRVFLAPPEELRRKWKVQRDCSRRGYTTDQVLDGARPARARLGGVHPPAAALGGHRRLVHAGRPRRPGAPRRRAHAARRPRPPRPERAHRTATPQGMRLSEDERRAPPVDPGRHRRRARRRRSRRRSGSACTSPATCAPSAWASSPSAPSCTARSRWRSSSCWSSTTSSRRGRASRWAARARASTAWPSGPEPRRERGARTRLSA